MSASGSSGRGSVACSILKVDCRNVCWAIPSTLNALMASLIEDAANARLLLGASLPLGESWQLPADVHLILMGCRARPDRSM